MELHCQDDRFGCKYSGDLFQCCPKYSLGSTEDGDPIFARKNFPLYCRDCIERDFDFCLLYRDLICFNEQNPLECKADLLNDKLCGEELIKKTMEATKRAFLKRNLPDQEPCV